MSPWKVLVQALRFLGTGHAAPPVREDHSFAFAVRFPYAQVAPLFGAWTERLWAGPDWRPRFIFPNPPEDLEGMVFTVPHGRRASVWLNTAFDLERGRVQYAYVVPGVQAVLIDIALSPSDEGGTAAEVRYRRTALASRHNARVREMARNDAASGPLWARQIEASLAMGSGQVAEGVA